MRHFFTVDVEEHFQVSAFADAIPRSSWVSHASRVAANVDRLIELLGRHGARGTFFVLGMVADRTPNVVRAIHAAGHEVASHGWDHRRVTEQTPDEFRSSVRRSKALLEDLVGTAVLGFRAPSYSIVGGCEWALEILADAGYQYDSSLFPVHRPGYGYAGGARDPYWLERAGMRLAELPPATWRVLGANIPAAGGAYFRIFPYQLVRAALRQCEARGVPGVFYVHPWEVDPEQPRLRVSLTAQWRHYTGLRRTVPRLQRLLAEFRFTAIVEGLRKPALVAAS
jgi:polysaccharide deacetylase family protein (PEP-CTERM system associated)